MKNRAGEHISNLTGELNYYSFSPRKLPPDPPLELTGDIIELLVRANRQLAYLESLSSHIPDNSLFVAMYVRKEALLSSQIEGTQATLEDILDPMLEKNCNRNVADVINYIKATEFALKRLNELPICVRLLKETHAVLMKGVRGQEKSPGEFRYTQNWIGGQGSTIKNARFIPPNPADMIEAMSDLEKYINTDDSYDPLIQASLIHYQFETIHPFLDGNGRIGRLLVMLYLIEKKVLSSPSLYISCFLKANRIEYYDRLSQVRSKGDYEQWVRFFLQALSESAEDAFLTIEELKTLHDKNHAIVYQKDRSAKTISMVLRYLESNPIIEISKTAEDLGLAFNTVSKAVGYLQSVNIVTLVKKQTRNRIYSYTEYLNILRKGT